MSVTASDLEFYLQKKALLLEETKRGNGSTLKRRLKYVGLRNQGATCYLNSLLQILFYDAEFCRLILSCSDHNGSRIVHELQKLFAELVCSNRNAVDTAPLLTAFGWSKSQMFEQHDIHEFFSVLLDALGKESTSLNGEISRLFEGSAFDTLLCSSCKHKSTSSNSFLNISIDIPDHLEIEAIDDGEKQTLATGGAAVPFTSLLSLIKAQLAAEKLDEDNKWTCSHCSKQVCALKLMQYKKLPELLMVHLKRFRFDPITKRRRKLATPITFPAELDAESALKLDDEQLKDFAVGDGSPNSVTASVVNSFGKYRLTAIVLHTGTAMGGHYRSYIQPQAGGPWIDCNDDHLAELSAEEQSELFADASADGAVAGAAAAAAAGGGSSITKKHSLVHENAYMLVYRLQDTADADAAASANDHPMAALKPLIPADVVKEIDEANANHDVVLRLNDIRSKLIEVDLKLTGVAGADASSEPKTVSLTVLRSATVKEITAQAHQLFVQQGLLDAAAYPLAQCRVRRFLRSGSSKLGETFGDGEGVTAEDIGLQPLTTSALAFEVRRAEDAAFIEFHANDMYLTIALWDQNTLSTDPKTEQEVLVPGREHATVEGLTAAVAEALQLPPTTVLLLHDTTAEDSKQPISVLADAAAELLLTYRVFPGSRIVVESLSAEAVAAAKANAIAAEPVQSAALAALEQKRNSATILFNDPSRAEGAADAEVYDLSAQVQLNQTLADVKAVIAKQLGLDGGADAFHVKRSANGPQLKDESKTLSELALVDQSILHLAMGSGCKSGEHLLRFELDTAAVTSTSGLASLIAPAPAAAGGAAVGKNNTDDAAAASNTFALIGDIVVSEKSTVLQVKQQLCEKWAELMAKLPPPPAEGAQDPPHPHTFNAPATAHHIRLRDGKGGKVSGPLRDDRLVSRCLLGLADGRRIVVQLLEQEEHIAADDLVIAVRVASYENKVLSPPVDVPVSRTSTVQNLFEKLITLMPQLKEVVPEATAEDYKVEAQLAMTSGQPIDADQPDFSSTLPESAFISLAKGYTSGPPLNLKSALKLKWDEEEVLKNAAELTLDRPPLNLRDGSIIVVRGKADFTRAMRTMRAKKAAAEQYARENGLEPAAGAGSAAVRAKSRARSRGRASRPRSQGGFAAAREKGLRIDGNGGDAGAGGERMLANSASCGIISKSSGVQFEISAALADEVNDASSGSPKKGISISTGSGRPPNPLGDVDGAKVSPQKPATTVDPMEHSMEDLPPPQQ